MMTWPALWTAATAQTRRRVSADLGVGVFLSSPGSGLPQLLGRALCRAVLTSLVGAKGVSAMEPREKFLASVSLLVPAIGDAWF